MMRSLTDTPRRPRSRLAVLGKGLRWTRRAIGKLIIRHANRKRNSAYWIEAGNLYRLAMLFVPERQDIAVQAGNCFKEAGRFALALRQYEKVTEPAQKAEALLQRGDTLARGGAAAEAIVALEESVALGHARADARLSEVSQFGLVGAVEHASKAPRLNQPLAERFLLNRLTYGKNKDRRWLGSLDRTTHDKVAGEGVFWREHIAFTQVGWLKVRHEGRSEPLLTGVVAIRARIVSQAAIQDVRLTLDGRQIADGLPVKVDSHSSGRRLYAINIWLDTAALPEGRKTLSLSADATDGGTQIIKTSVIILRTPDDLDLKVSDAFVPSSTRPLPGDVASEVVSRPTNIRPASRRFIESPVRNILAMRVDQLGDLSASLPALRRLRELFPQAHLVALVAPGLTEVVRETGFCDEVQGLRLDYDHATERRYLDVKEEQRLQRAFLGRRFDLAIDLCPGDETRALLKMFNAQFLAGFNPRVFDFLDFGIDVISRDKVNRIARIPHASSVRMLIDGLAEVQTPERPASPRLQDDRALLAKRGLMQKNYLLIHTGARHPLNQWPMVNFIELANRLAESTDAPVVFFSDKPLDDALIQTVRHQERILVLETVQMDVFDALVSNAAVMIGNDSGPKHLAAARGVEVVSLHVNRLNWNEWGQESRGLILTKKVPCCGCGLNDVKMCAKDVLCLTSIAVEDAFEAVMDRWAHVMATQNDRPTLP